MFLKGFRFLFIFCCFVIIHIDYIYALDPFKRLKYNHKYFIATFNNEIIPNIYNEYYELDSNVSISSNTLIHIDNNIPIVKTGVLFSGMHGSFSWFLEPILVNEKYGHPELGTEYSRNNISGRIENAVVTYKKDNFNIYFGRSPIRWGQSLSRSIIQSGLYPSYDHLILRYQINNIYFEILSGQLGSRKLDNGDRIKRNLGGHRFIWKINKKMSFTIGEQIIYTGKNRNVEITYLNPFVPYFFTGLEGDEVNAPYDNDNSIIFVDFRYLAKSDFSFYGELIIDDIQIDDTGVDDALGMKIGLDGYINMDNNHLFWVFEWTRILPWTYIHHGQFTSWEQRGHPIGFSFGPDSDCLELKFFGLYKKVNIYLDFNYLVKGSNNLDTPYDNFSNNNVNKIKDKYLFSKIGFSHNYKSLKIEAGWMSKNYIESIIVNNFQPSKSGMLYFEIIARLNKKFNLY